APMDRALCARHHATRAAGRHTSERRQSAACGGHLVQRQEALVSRSTGAHPQPAKSRDIATIAVPMQGTLNLFQATMLRWRELHPYNAVHVVVVGQPLQPARLTTCIACVLESA